MGLEESPAISNSYPMTHTGNTVPRREAGALVLVSVKHHRLSFRWYLRPIRKERPRPSHCQTDLPLSP